MPQCDPLDASPPFWSPLGFPLAPMMARKAQTTVLGHLGPFWVCFGLVLGLSKPTVSRYRVRLQAQRRGVPPWMSKLYSYKPENLGTSFERLLIYSQACFCIYKKSSPGKSRIGAPPGTLCVMMGPFAPGSSWLLLVPPGPFAPVAQWLFCIVMYSYAYLCTVMYTRQTHFHPPPRFLERAQPIYMSLSPHLVLAFEGL